MNNHVTVLEIDANAILHNLNFFRQRLQSETKILVVVKAFGYGTNSVEIAKIVEDHADYLAVAYTHEGIALREAGIETPILVFYPQIATFEELVAYRLEPALYNFKSIEAFLELADKKPLMNYPIHLKFNTGLNRIGFWHSDTPKILSQLKESNNVKVQTIFSHLAASEDINEQEFTINQINTFAYIVKQMYTHLGYEPDIHILNTSGIVNYSKAQFDMVRLGIGLYGFGNHPEITAQLKNTHTLKTVITQIHLVEQGETVGYNRAFVASKPTKSATIPIGHADGLSRKLGNKKYAVMVNNQLAPIIGNVCMDMVMIDVTDIPCKEGDEVIIFNNQKTISKIAACCETIPYEILTGLSQRIKRIVK